MEGKLQKLSRRECSMIACLADGFTNKQIGERFGLSENDVQEYLHKMMQKKGFYHSYQLISWAYLDGVLK
ncbi:helix-turn-helix transcriptional regulator [Pontibacter toksunensis]|uniref:Helix-turn-helix transcriptional regulator n=1 Tax=Pontibacter toksunensis TaxID=1332631 RepID=A0ABW6C1Y9_9BACT